ncbi:hypothetical protein [Brachyspira hampsonii]|uniref:Uncharacterized protein n=1 Tax=Brachyspira hampsonii TaxID=1287055 RepID=A0AAC9TT85_9SPIR|nr:hypothetical protein [Brachyspira hampsonii]ASJ21513.1 hypothetical protein BHAMNSH16_07615 [Brachyspira hampsonii]ELV06115.1 hypothetical protein H263_06042 [Brachyspira hampsonii 30599]OEJ17985.1 hypothetical protein A9496_09270 [Brachyspira hampsonii]
MIKKIYILILAMIIIISCANKNPNNNTGNGENGGGGTTTEINKYDTLFLKFTTDDKTVPTFTFFEDDGQTPNGVRKWEKSNDGTNTCYIYNAPDGENKNGIPNSPGNSLPVNKTKIYVYRGVNPFKTAVENEIEKQFYFYRYTGNALVDLDNFLVAVDTKTGLVFPYAVPEKWKNMFISWAPDGWISAELGRTGKPQTTDEELTFAGHKFWQYDPIGQVNDDGSVTLQQFYIDAQGNSDYKPVYSGKSPYKDIQ